MADSVRTIFIRYVTQWGGSEKGVTRIAKETKALRKEQGAFNAEITDTIKNLEKAAKTRKFEAFDTSRPRALHGGPRRR